MRASHIALATLLVAAAPAVCIAQSAPQSPSTYVIVHGAWGGGWDWRTIDSLLSSQGHAVHRVTLTGLGERVHLASPSVGLATHITDVVNTIEFEQLTNVILVGHSYGGMVITGVADKIPQRIRHLVYLDAFLPESGESLSDLAGAEFRPFIASNTKDGMVQAPWEGPEKPFPKDVPQPLKTLTDTLVLSNPVARGIPATYILTVDKGKTEDQFSRYADRAAARNFTVRRMEADHVPERSAPKELSVLLLQVP